MRKNLPDPTKPLAHLQKQVARAITRQIASAPAHDGPVMTGRNRALAELSRFIARGQRGGVVL